MNMMRFRRGMMVMAAPIAAAVIGLVASDRTARAEGEDKTAFNERCATRLSLAVLGKSPDASLAKSKDPQSAIDGMLHDAVFIDRFATFINTQSNSGPGAGPQEDAVYYLAKTVLERQLPWKELYVGKFKVELNAEKTAMVVGEDPEGLGYFRSIPWQRRYAGNEAEGYKLPTAFRMLQNTIGVELVATTNEPGRDDSAQGRKASACKGCHYDKWFALDKIAKVLTRRKGTDDAMTFTPPTEGPQQVLDGQTAKDDKDVVTYLVESKDFKFRACRLAFKFLYGRSENQCEAPLFDKCMGEFDAKGTIQSAVAVVAKDPGFCQ